MRQFHCTSINQTRPMFELTGALWMYVKVLLLTGKKVVIEVKLDTRNTQQNALLHAILNQIAKTKEWAGAKRNVDDWKRLTMAAWLRARGENVEMLPAIDGQGIDVVWSKTSNLSKADFAEYVDWIYAWCAMNDVEIKE